MGSCFVDLIATNTIVQTDPKTDVRFKSYCRLNFFFLENAGELRFIALEREKGPHTTPFSHTGTKYER